MPAATEDPAPADPGTAADGGQTVSGASAGTLWRRYRVALFVLAAILGAAVAIAIVQARGPQGRLDPRSADPDGGQALATLLGERGVQVERITDPDTITVGLRPGDAVLVAFPGQLDPDTARALGDSAQGTLVLLHPAAQVLGPITARVRADGTTAVRRRSPDCADAAAVAAGDALGGGATYVTDEGERCYGDGGDDAPLITGSTRGGARLVVLGTGAMLTNERLDEDGNAALALNLLGADGSADRLRWLVPAPGPTAADQRATSILPDWVLPALLQLLFAGALVALWRGRRLGPPVVEPLPVVVRAAEAVEGRARLYRRAQARDRAADALRAGALARLVPRLGIESPAGGEPPAGAVVAAAATRSGRPDAAVHATLFGPPPADDAALVSLAGTLDSLVRDTLDPEGPHQ